MPNCAPTKKQVMNGIISIFMNARPVTFIGSALFVRRYAIMDMIWFIWVILTGTVIVEQEEEMNHARYGNKGCRVFKRGVQN